MGPRIKALAKSESKKRFLERIGLAADNVAHQALYLAMKAEATQGRARIVAEIADEQYGRTVSIREYQELLLMIPDRTPPNESRLHQEILRIYEDAPARTKAIYELGHDGDGVVEENWIIRWMLWHVCRYKEQRPRKRGPSGSGTDTSGNVPVRGRFWDSVREQWKERQ